MRGGQTYIWGEAYVVVHAASLFPLLCLLAVIELMCGEVLVACEAVEHSYDTPHVPEYAPPRHMLSSELCNVRAQLPVVVNLVQPNARGGTARIHVSGGWTSSGMLLSYTVLACCNGAWKQRNKCWHTCCLLGN